MLRKSPPYAFKVITSATTNTSRRCCNSEQQTVSADKDIATAMGSVNGRTRRWADERRMSRRQALRQTAAAASLCAIAPDPALKAESAAMADIVANKRKNLVPGPKWNPEKNPMLKRRKRIRKKEEN